MKTWFLTIISSILTQAIASPAGSLQRRANEMISFATQQQFILQPSNTLVISLWRGVQTYIQRDGNFVMSVPSLQSYFNTP